jgi:hypothetical protein
MVGLFLFMNSLLILNNPQLFSSDFDGEKNTSCFAFDYEALHLSIEDVKPELDSDDQKFFENLQET